MYAAVLLQESKACYWQLEKAGSTQQSLHKQETYKVLYITVSCYT